MDPDLIQRNFALPKSTVGRLNTLNVWGRIGPSELTDIAIRLLFDVTRMLQQNTGADLQSILSKIQKAVEDPSVREKIVFHIGQPESPVSPELFAIFLSIIKGDNSMFTESSHSAQAVEIKEGGGMN